MDLQEQADVSSFINMEEEYQSLLEVFKTRQLTSGDLLLSTVDRTAKKVNRTPNQIQSFIERYSKETTDSLLGSICGIPDTCDERLTFSTGDEHLDDDLNGGFPIGYLIELAGKASSGKTNMLLQLSISIQLPREFGGLGPSIYYTHSDDDNHVHKRSKIEKLNNVKTLYISTESALPTNRLVQIIDHFDSLIEGNGITKKDNLHLFPNLQNVITTAKVPTSLEEQDHIIYYQVPALLTKNPGIKLLILDSITHHTRVELEWRDQQAYIRRICKYLKELAQIHSLTIIITNQVTDKPISGIYRGNDEANSLVWKLNSEYQLAWLEGWDEVGVMYRQLLKRDGIVDLGGDGFEKLDYLDNEEAPEEDGTEERPNNVKDLKMILKHERKVLFDSSYKVKISGITTRPALGSTLLEFIDMRCVLSRAFKPVFNEKLIDEFSNELGIDTSIDESMTDSQQPIGTQLVVEQLSNNNYLQNHNFEWFRVLQVPFGPLIKSGGISSDFEIWKGGIRHKSV